MDDRAFANRYATKHRHARTKPHVVSNGHRQEVIMRIVRQSFAMVPVILGDDQAILAAVEVVSDAQRACAVDPEPVEIDVCSQVRGAVQFCGAVDPQACRVIA